MILFWMFRSIAESPEFTDRLRKTVKWKHRGSTICFTLCATFVFWTHTTPEVATRQSSRFFDSPQCSPCAGRGLWLAVCSAWAGTSVHVAFCSQNKQCFSGGYSAVGIADLLWSARKDREQTTFYTVVRHLPVLILHDAGCGDTTILSFSCPSLPLIGCALTGGGNKLARCIWREVQVASSTVWHLSTPLLVCLN